MIVLLKTYTGLKQRILVPKYTQQNRNLTVESLPLLFELNQFWKSMIYTNILLMLKRILERRGVSFLKKKLNHKKILPLQEIYKFHLKNSRMNENFNMFI